MNTPELEKVTVNQSKLPAQIFRNIVARSGSARNRKKIQQEAWENFGKPGRDFTQFQGVMSSFAQAQAWIPYLKLAQLRNHWDQVVGIAIAQHSQVVDCTDGILSIRTESPAWTTQLTYLIPQLEQTIRQRLAGLEIREIKVTGPQQHSFSRGRGFTKKHH